MKNKINQVYCYMLVITMTLCASSAFALRPQGDVNIAINCHKLTPEQVSAIKDGNTAIDLTSTTDEPTSFYINVKRGEPGHYDRYEMMPPIDEDRRGDYTRFITLNSLSQIVGISGSTTGGANLFSATRVREIRGSDEWLWHLLNMGDYRCKTVVTAIKTDLRIEHPDTVIGPK